MIKASTVYEIRKALDENFTSISSNSVGSIQAAMKKLLAGGLVMFKEVTENGKDKKIYELTDKGKSTFFTAISKPMLYKEKNMELAKFFFMGFAPKQIRIELIDSYLFNLIIEKSNLDKIFKSVNDARTAAEDYIRFLNENDKAEYLKKTIGSDFLPDSIKDITLFQYATLEFSMAKVDFEIQWFEQFKKRLGDGNEN